MTPVQISGIYAYSFTPFLLTALLCGAIPFNWVQWSLLGYSIATSSVFLGVAFWNDLNSQQNNLDVKKRLLIIGMVCAVQATWWLLFKLYFFKRVT
jgi:hypothetical protein